MVYALLLIIDYVFRLTPSLRKRLLSAYNLEKIPAIQWGIMHESVALHQYECLGAQVEKTG